MMTMTTSNDYDRGYVGGSWPSDDDPPQYPQNETPQFLQGWMAGKEWRENYGEPFIAPEDRDDRGEPDAATVEALFDDLKRQQDALNEAYLEADLPN
jgi:hypothetical protein